MCPQLPFAQRGRAVRLTKGTPDFSALLQQIARPSGRRTPDRICPAYALAPEYVMASADGHWYVVDLPLDGCGHYPVALLDLLNRLRS